MQEQNGQIAVLEVNAQEQAQNTNGIHLRSEDYLIEHKDSLNSAKIHPFFHGEGKVSSTASNPVSVDIKSKRRKKKDEDDSKDPNDVKRVSKARRKTTSDRDAVPNVINDIQDEDGSFLGLKGAHEVSSPIAAPLLDGDIHKTDVVSKKRPQRKRRKVDIETLDLAPTVSIPSSTSYNEQSLKNGDLLSSILPSSPPLDAIYDQILVPTSSPILQSLPTNKNNIEGFPPSSDIVIIDSEPNDLLSSHIDPLTSKIVATKQLQLPFIQVDQSTAIPAMLTDPPKEKPKTKRRSKKSLPTIDLPQLQLSPSPHSVRQTADRLAKTKNGIVVLNISSSKLSKLVQDLESRKIHRYDPKKPLHPFFSKNPTIKEALPPGDKVGKEQTKESGDKSAFLKFALSGPKSLGSTYKSKWPMGLEAPWPESGSVHVRGLEDNYADRFSLSHLVTTLVKSKRKDKSRPNIVSQEDSVLLSLTQRLMQAKFCGPNLSNDIANDIPSSVRIPKRLELSASSILKSMRSILNTRMTSNNMHAAIRRIRDHIASSDKLISPFDQGKCETQLWTVKYAPKRADEVLQSGKEAILLKEWLGRMKVWAVEGAALEGKSKKSTRTQQELMKKKRKKRKRPDDLDDFLVSEDEEENGMDEITDPEDDVQTIPGTSILLGSRKSLIRHGELLAPSNNMDSGEEFDGDILVQQQDTSVKVMNTIVLSGPHGVGKTAAVYAAAQEHDFTVFEVNAGYKRGGKEILELVGEMTRNHLVHQQKDKDKHEIKTKTENSQSFFHTSNTRTMAAKDDHSTISKNQKQSLILIEEADLLYEEDKQFWPTVISLISSSKRPIIITCNDESLLPLDSLPLHAILRYQKPPMDATIDYLLLLAAAEGHMLERYTVQTLFEECNSDLRKTIMQLDFWCQMTVGDRTGGMKWWIKRWPPCADLDDDGEILRCISSNTMLPRMGTFGRDLVFERFDPATRVASVRDDVLWCDIYESTGVDTGERLFQDLGDLLKELPNTLDSRCVLDDYTDFADALSAADVYAGGEVRSGGPFERNNSNSILLDTTQRPMSGKERLDIVVGHKMLQTDAPPLLTNTERSIAMYIRSASSNLLQQKIMARSSPQKASQPLEELAPGVDKFASTMFDSTKSRPGVRLTRQHLLHPFDHLANLDIPFAIAPTVGNSQFLRPTNLVVTEIVPFVREIARHDIAIEEQRKIASSLLSVAGDGTRKRRSTRAAALALEGRARGTRGSEKYLKGNPHAMVATAGVLWGTAVQNIVQAMTMEDDICEDNNSLDMEASDEP